MQYDCILYNFTPPHLELVGLVFQCEQLVAEDVHFCISESGELLDADRAAQTGKPEESKQFAHLRHLLVGRFCFSYCYSLHTDRP